MQGWRGSCLSEGYLDWLLAEGSLACSKCVQLNSTWWMPSCLYSAHVGGGAGLPMNTDQETEYYNITVSFTSALSFYNQVFYALFVRESELLPYKFLWSPAPRVGSKQLTAVLFFIMSSTTLEVFLCHEFLQLTFFQHQNITLNSKILQK